MKKHLIVPCIALCACGGKPTNGTRPQAPDILAENIDSTVRPGDDFFHYACGAWIKRNPIPASESGWTIGHLVYEEIYVKKRAINEDAAKENAPEGSDARRIADFWSTAMDSAKADAEGVRPLEPELKAIDAIKDADDAVRTAADLSRKGCDVFWSLFVEQDPKKSDLMAAALDQGGLGLPDRDFYFNPEEGVAKARAEYPKHIARMLKLLGQPEADAVKAGDAVMELETAMAKASRALDQLRDPDANYHKMAVEGLRMLAPSVGWRAMLDGFGLQACDTVIVGQPEFVQAMDVLLRKTPVANLRDYLRYHLLTAYAPFLGSALDKENFDFNGRVLSGAKNRRPRWKRALDAEERAIGMVLGREFVKRYVPLKMKKRYDDLAEAVRASYREHIQLLEWMSPATKEKALAKLAAVTKKVIYPDKWPDMSALKIGRDSYAANMMRAHQWRSDHDIHKWGRPVDRTEWYMTPQTYNAEYSSGNNDITLPAAIFFISGLPDSLADDALVYGYAAASTIGHEITHGFDDEGRKYDMHGNLTPWWSPEDTVKFQHRAEAMAKQFDAYEPIKGLHINGHATLGENIADLGGIVLALDAFKKTEQYKRNERIAGLTPLQRYFLGYALGWLGSEREEELRQQLLSDVHSPAQYRVNGPLANVPEFYDAFGVKPGDPMWRADSVRVRIW